MLTAVRTGSPTEPRREKIVPSGNFACGYRLGGKFAKDDAFLASGKGKVITGTRRITGRIYRALAALRPDRFGSIRIGEAEAQAASAIRPVNSNVSLGARMIEWRPFRFVSHTR